jgi:DNA replication protein
MKKSTSDLISIARAGGGLRLDAASNTTSDLISIARAISEGSRLIIYNSDSKTTSDLISIARAGGNKVVFE